MLRCGSVRFRKIENPTVPFGAFFESRKWYGAVRCFHVSYGAVWCGFHKSGILWCGSVRLSDTRYIVNLTVQFGAVINPTERFGAVPRLTVFATVRDQSPSGINRTNPRVRGVFVPGTFGLHSTQSQESNSSSTHKKTDSTNNK